jgi:Mg2+ and Co2+ transporter CorA
VLKAFLYDAEGHDREIDLFSGPLPDLEDHQLLWIDATERDPSEMARVADLLKLRVESHADLTRGVRTFKLANYGHYIHFDVAALRHERAAAGSPRPTRTSRLDIAIGPGWLLTSHEPPVPFLEEFRDQDRGQTLIGSLTPAALAASLLDWHLGVYLAALEDVESFADRVDVRMLSASTVRDDLLKELVGARRHISGLRRSLAPQSAIFYGLSRPDIAANAGADSASFAHLEHRFERVLDAVEHGRDLIQTSFDLFTTRTAETTNTLIRRLTFISIMLGALGGVAGVFGMNFETPYQKSGLVGFWAVVMTFAVLSAAGAIVGRLRKWF